VSRTQASAVATRSVDGLADTSTMRARPDSLKCVSSAMFLGKSEISMNGSQGIIKVAQKPSQGK
jgi:hypothetical protein